MVELPSVCYVLLLYVDSYATTRSFTDNWAWWEKHSKSHFVLRKVSYNFFFVDSMTYSSLIQCRWIPPTELCQSRIKESINMPFSGAFCCIFPIFDPFFTISRVIIIGDHITTKASLIIAPNQLLFCY